MIEQRRLEHAEKQYASNKKAYCQFPEPCTFRPCQNRVVLAIDQLTVLFQLFGQVIQEIPDYPDITISLRSVL